MDGKNGSNSKAVERGGNIGIEKGIVITPIII